MDFIWILFAFACGMGAKLANLPSLIGYLSAGFILHFVGLEPLQNLDVLANIGISLMLFTIGLKLEIRDLLKREIWLSAVSHMLIWSWLIFALIFLLALIFSPVFFGISGTAAAILAFALSFSSTVCILKILEDSGELTTRHGRLAVGILIMQDIIAVLYLVIVAGKVPSVWALLLISLWWMRPLLQKILAHAGHSELLPLAGFMLALGGYEIFEAVGIKGDLGALAVGILLAGSDKSTELAKSLLSFKDLFLIGFFLSIGFTALPDWSMLLTALLLALFLVFKFFLFFFIFAMVRLRIRTTFLAALALTNYSEFGLIVLAMSANLGLIDNRWLVILALAISISFVITGVIYRSAHKYFAHLKKRLKPFESKLRLKEDVYLQPKNAEILVLGMGRVGRGAYNALHQLVGNRVWGMDANRDRVKKQKRMGMHVFPGDGEDPDVWETFDLSKIKLVLLALPSVQDSHNITQQIRNANYKGKIAAIARYQDEKEKLLHSGIDNVFNFFTEAGTGFAEESLLMIENQADFVSDKAPELPKF